MANYGNGYQRFSMFPPVIKWLLAINLAIFVLEAVVLPAVAGGIVGLRSPNGVHPIPITQIYGALWPPDASFFQPWQYLTYMFEHGNFTHVFFNMLMLWMFGIELEQTWGSKRFLIYYVLSGLGAGLLHTLITTVFGMGSGYLVGASGAVMGIMIGFGLMFPNRVVMAFFFFPMPARLAVMVFVGLDLVLGIVDAKGDNVAHFAHLGGALTGYILLKTSGMYLISGLFKKIKEREHPGMQAFRTATQPQQPVYSRGNVIDVNFRETPRHIAPKMDFGDDQARIDAILDKISRQGYQSLTDEEKAILTSASRRM